MYLFCFIAAMCGQFLQIVLKLKSLSAKAKLAEQQYTLIDYLKDDMWTQIGGILFVLIVLISVDEVLNWKDWLLNYIKFFFSFIGFSGAEIATKIYSRANDKVNDLLTNFGKEK